MFGFTKMEGLGNDYIYVDCTKKTENEINDIVKLTPKISDRHFGIGSDGLILICKSDVADFKMQMYNKDGSQAEMCGNGIRCVGKFVYDKGLTNKLNINIETLAGIKTLEMNIEKGKVSSVMVNMGRPVFDADLIPCVADYSTENVPHIKLHILDKDFDLTCVSIGNPHAITFVDNVDNFDVEKYGKIIECDKHFPQKINVEFVEVIDNHSIKMRVWERGAGETLACGTGATASAIMCMAIGLTTKNEETTVKLLGGDLNIKWDDYAYMTGPAVNVFDGIYTE